MDLDPLSPIAPARVKCLLLPIGKISNQRFQELSKLVKQCNIVRVGDVKPDGRPNRTMFSPLAFPSGSIFYDYSTASVSPSRLQLSPFEVFREPLMVLALADALEFDVSRPEEQEVATSANNDTPYNIHSVEDSHQTMLEQWPRVLVHKILLFDAELKDSSLKDIILVHSSRGNDIHQLKSALCEATSSLLAELTTYAKSLQGLESIESPKSLHSFTTSNGSSSPQDNWDQASRRASHLIESSNFTRPKTATDETKNSHRMSMPAQLPSSQPDRSTPISNVRPTSPDQIPSTAPATTFDEISAGSKTGSRISSLSTLSRSTATVSNSDYQKNRVSMSGFGSGSLSERARNKGKGRIGVAIGTLFLLAGRWNDALKELSESAIIAKTNSDHLWHGKALENILVCLLIFAWAGLAFQIPDICYLNTESPLEVAKSLKSASDGAPKSSTDALHRIIPDLVTNILNLYVRAANFAGEKVLQLPFSESTIRLSKLLAIISGEGDGLSQGALQKIVENKILKSSNTPTPRPIFGARPSRTEIASIVLRAYPPAVHDLSVTDHALILAGIASVFAMMQFHRKKAIVILELMSILIPGLADARKAGAAELGVHPAAGLAALNSTEVESTSLGALGLDDGNMATNVREVLSALCRLYGIVHLASSASSSQNSESSDDSSPRTDSNEEISFRIYKLAELANFGSQDIKSVVLRTCINLCEVLPDFHGVLRFTSVMLRATTQNTFQLSRPIHFAREEQIRLSTDISRTVMVAKKLGVANVEADYWDENLLFAIELIELPASRKLIKHAREDIGSVNSSKQKNEKEPFLYNPFMKKTSTMTAKQMVQDEVSEFRVLLRNPFEFIITIEFIRLEADGVEFECQDVSVDLIPNSLQSVALWGTPKSSGKLSIDGCIAKVKGCHLRRFPIPIGTVPSFREAKVKETGLRSLAEFAGSRISSLSNDSYLKDGAKKAIDFAILAADVLEVQPLMAIDSVSLSQNSIMLLEGETQTFSVKLKNISSVPVDFVTLSFKDSTEGPLQVAMENKNVTSTELYELELMYSRKRAFSWEQDIESSSTINSGETKTFSIRIFGKPGLTDGLVQVDYGFIDASKRLDKTYFHTRQLLVPVNVTVNASVELIRGECLPYINTDPQKTVDFEKSQGILSATGTFSAYCDIFSGIQKIPNLCELFILLIDVRNAWPTPFNVTIACRQPSIDMQKESFLYETQATIQPGHTERFLVPLKRILISNPYEVIPSLNPSKTARFRVSKAVSEAELASRACFWYKEEILKCLTGSWHDEQINRTGMIEMRSIRISPRFVDAVRMEDVSLSLSLTSKDAAPDTDCQIVNQIGVCKYKVNTECFLLLTVRVSNQTSKRLELILRIQPSLAHQSHHLGLDMTRKFAWCGLLQRAIPVIEPGESTEVENSFCVLCPGNFEISASVEEISPGHISKGDGLNDFSDPASTKAAPDLGQRGLWHSRMPCVIFAEDTEE